MPRDAVTYIRFRIDPHNLAADVAKASSMMSKAFGGRVGSGEATGGDNPQKGAAMTGNIRGMFGYAWTMMTGVMASQIGNMYLNPSRSYAEAVSQMPIAGMLSHQIGMPGSSMTLAQAADRASRMRGMAGGIIEQMAMGGPVSRESIQSILGAVEPTARRQAEASSLLNEEIRRLPEEQALLKSIDATLTRISQTVLDLFTLGHGDVLHNWIRERGQDIGRDLRGD